MYFLSYNLPAMQERLAVLSVKNPNCFWVKVSMTDMTLSSLPAFSLQWDFKEIACLWLGNKFLLLLRLLRGFSPLTDSIQHISLHDGLQTQRFFRWEHRMPKRTEKTMPSREALDRALCLSVLRCWKSWIQRTKASQKPRQMMLLSRASLTGRQRQLPWCCHRQHRQLRVLFLTPCSTLSQYHCI